MQHEAYSDGLWVIVNTVRERFLDAERILRCSTTMSVQVRELESIDHRTVQDIHDLVAAWYRFKRKGERMFPLLGNDLRSDWIQFITAEARELCSSPEFVTGVLDACIHANTKCGYAGESRSRQIQRERYAEMIRYTGRYGGTQKCDFERD